MRRSVLTIIAIAGLALPGIAQAEPVKITNIGHGYFSGALYVAKSAKLFEKHGLEPQITFVKGGSLAFQSVLTKQADITLVSYEHIVNAAVQGKNVVAIFRLVSRPVNNVTISDKLAEGTDKMSLEQKVQVLKDKRIAMPSANGSGEKMLKFLAKTYKLDPANDFKGVYLGSEPGSYVAAFKRGIVDAAVAVEPVGVLLKQDGIGKILINVMNGEVPAFSNMIFIVVATHPDTVKAKPELLRKVAAVFQDAVDLIKKDPKRAKELLGKEYPNMSAKANSEVFDTLNQAWPANGAMSQEQADATIAIVQPKGPAPLDVAKTYTNAFLPK